MRNKLTVYFATKLQLLADKHMQREPGIIIGGDENPYLKRWYVVPRNRLFNIYLHQIIRSDDDRALHDHPWPSLSLTLSGGVTEQYWDTKQERTRVRWFFFGDLIYRSSTFRHRLIVDDPSSPTVTMFITGPRIRNWGFWCKNYLPDKGPAHNFVPWRDFTSGANGERIGRGCGES